MTPGLARNLGALLLLGALLIPATTDAQIMVMHDMLGITPASIRVPKFVKNFMPDSTGGLSGAFEAYSEAVRNGSFPGPEHTFT